MHVVGLDDPLHELVADDVLGAEAHELDPLDLLEHVPHDDQPRLLLAGKVHLGDVAGDDHPRAEAQAREEHLHLLGRRVLGLVEDHERVVQRASAHERERSDLDHAALDVLGDLLRIEHVVQRVEQRAQVGIDLGHQVARQEAQALAGLDRGRVRMMRLTSWRASAAAAIATARNVLPVPAGPTPKVIVFVAHRVHVALLVDRLGGDAQPAVAPDDVLEHARGRLVRVERAGHRGDRPGADLVAAGDQL